MLVAEPDFINGDYDIHWLERLIGDDAGVRRADQCMRSLIVAAR